MLTIASLGKKSSSYYLNLAREDYYRKGGEPPGRWFGLGALALKLFGLVKEKQLERLLDGYAPEDNYLLVQNAGAHDRQPGWDLTFSAPKSVSVVWAMADEATRQRIEQCHQQAVDTALSYLEEEAALTRRGKQGLLQEPAKLIIAEFDHATSRELDPQIHTHCLVANACVRDDRSTGTVVSLPFYMQKMTAGALYRSQLSYLLERELGLNLQRDQEFFTVVGVPEKLVTELSKRSQAIDARLDELGLYSAKAAAVAALDTRDPKAIVPREELFTRWQETGKEHGFTAEEVHELLGQAQEKEPGEQYREALETAVSRMNESYSHFSEREFLRHVFEETQARGLDAGFVRDGVSLDLKDNDRFVILGGHNGEIHYATREMFELEKELLARAARLDGSESHAVADRTIERCLERNQHLNEEQKDAVRHVVGDGSIKFVNGMAGTGKTTMIGVAAEMWEREGYRVIGATLSGKAAIELQEGSGIKSETLAMTQIKLETTALDMAKHHLAQLVKTAVGLPTYRIEQLSIDARTILVIDEAGMLGTRQYAHILKHVEEGGGKVVFVGDRDQLQAIEVGGPFGSLSKRQGCAMLEQIVRQEDTQDIHNIKSLAKGDAASALANYAERGLLTVSETKVDSIRQLVSDWSVRGAADPKSHIILTGTRVEAAAANRECQAERLIREPHPYDRWVQVGDEALHCGDRVLLGKNSKRLGVRNGDLGTIIGINPNGNEIAIELDRETKLPQPIIIPLKDYDHVSLGYAMTTHKAQGMTAENTYILLGEMQDRELSYVQFSRARGTTRAYTNEVEAGENMELLVAAMERSRAKDLAHDVMHRPDRDHRMEHEQEYSRSL